MDINDVVRITDQASKHFDKLGVVVFAVDGEDLCVIELAGEKSGTPFLRNQLEVASPLELENRALRHALDTIEGLWAVDHQPANEPDAFRLEFFELRRREPGTGA